MPTFTTVSKLSDIFRMHPRYKKKDPKFSWIIRPIGRNIKEHAFILKMSMIYHALYFGVGKYRAEHNAIPVAERPSEGESSTNNETVSQV